MISIEELQREVARRAAEDREFRAQMLADPRAALNRAFGITVPDTMEVVVHACDMRTVHLVLPPVLDGEQLETVAAGFCCPGT